MLLKRGWFWLGAVGLAAIILGGVVAVTSTTRDSTEAFRKVKEGMTKDEVDQLLGDKDFMRTEFFGRFNRNRARSLVTYVEVGRYWRGSTETLAVELENGPTSKVKHVLILKLGSPYTRTLWQRLQDEYRYQKRSLGW